MASLYIKNIGPINEVSFKLNRINVFIGPQSSGKSTIAKIVSFCLWLEKDALIHQYVDYINAQFFSEKLLDFHKLSSYFNEFSVITYSSDIIEFTYTLQDFKIITKDGFKKGKVGKNAYIPAERNLITLDGIMSLPLGENNIRSFLFDWLNIHNKYTRENSLQLLNLNVKYYYQEDGKKDKLILNNGKEISLNEASSGLQSVVPLYVYLDYITKWVYEHAENISFEKKNKLNLAIYKKLVQTIDSSFKISNPEFDSNIANDPFLKDVLEQTLASGKERRKTLGDKSFDEVFALKENITRPHFSNIIIEEPEQNLFPETQVELIRDLLCKINKERDNLVITTHSPYVLYALNNCMMGGLVKEHVDEDDEECLLHKDSWIDPKLVSVYALKDGCFAAPDDSVNETIQDEEGLIRNNYFDRIMRNVMADFNNLMNYYEPYE